MREVQDFVAKVDIEGGRSMTEGPYKLPAGWRWVRLGEVCSKPQYGLTQAASKEAIGPKFVRITDITSGQIEWDAVPYCRIDTRTLEKYRLDKGDMLFARSGSVGATMLIKEKPPFNAVFASYLIRVRINDSVILPEFVDLFIKSASGQAQLVPQGAAQKNINAKLIQQLLIPLPPLEEQKRIVARIEELMGRVREARRLREEAKQEAERLWQAVLARTFPRPGSELPEGWRWVRLGEITDIQSGGTPKRSVKEYWGGGIPWAKISDIPEDGIVDQTEETITEKGLANSNAKLFPPGTVLFSIFATIGKVGILKITAATNQAIAGVTIRNPGEIESHFLFYCLRWFSSRVVTEGRGMAQNNINLTILRNTLIPLPPLEEQKRIVAYLQEVQEKIKALKEAQAQTEAELKRLEQAILEKAFRGDL